MKHPKNFRVVNLLMLTVAGIVNAFGITIFLTPVKLYDSGISGTSMLLEQITPPYLSLSFFLLLLNIPLFLFGLKKLGRLFTAYAIYTVAVYSLFAWLITDVFPIDVSIASPLAGTDLLLLSLIHICRKNTRSPVPGSRRLHQYHHLFCVLFYQRFYRWLRHLSGPTLRCQR